MERFVFLALISIAGLSSCATNQPIKTPGKEALTEIKTSVRYLAPDRSLLPRELFPNNVVILMPYLPGELFGNPTFEPIFAEQLPKDLKLSLDLGSVVNAVDENAKVLTTRWKDKGLGVFPENTRLARVGTFAFNPKTQEEIGSGGFIDPKSRDSLILIYVDQACTIVGKFSLGNEEFEHDIELPSGGFHFLRVKIVEKNRFVLKYFPKDNPVYFSIHILDMVRT